MKRLCWLPCLLFVLSARAETDVQINLNAGYLNANPPSNRWVTLQPLSPFIGNIYNYTSDNTGTFWASNLSAGTFSGNVKVWGSSAAIPFQLYVASTNLGAIQGATQFAVSGPSVQPPGTTAYSAYSSDQRYVQLGASVVTNVYVIASNGVVVVSNTPGSVYTVGLNWVLITNAASQTLSNLVGSAAYATATNYLTNVIGTGVAVVGITNQTVTVYVPASSGGNTNPPILGSQTIGINLINNSNQINVIAVPGNLVTSQVPGATNAVNATNLIGTILGNQVTTQVPGATNAVNATNLIGTILGSQVSTPVLGATNSVNATNLIGSIAGTQVTNAVAIATLATNVTTATTNAIVQAVFAYGGLTNSQSGVTLAGTFSGTFIGIASSGASFLSVSNGVYAGLNTNGSVTLSNAVPSGVTAAAGFLLLEPTNIGTGGGVLRIPTNNFSISDATGTILAPALGTTNLNIGRTVVLTRSTNVIELKAFSDTAADFGYVQGAAGWYTNQNAPTYYINIAGGVCTLYKNGVSQNSLVGSPDSSTAWSVTGGSTGGTSAYGYLLDINGLIFAGAFNSAFTNQAGYYGNAVGLTNLIGQQIVGTIDPGKLATSTTSNLVYFNVAGSFFGVGGTNGWAIQDANGGVVFSTPYTGLAELQSLTNVILQSPAIQLRGNTTFTSANGANITNLAATALVGSAPIGSVSNAIQTVLQAGTGISLTTNLSPFAIVIGNTGSSGPVSGNYVTNTGGSATNVSFYKGVTNYGQFYNMGTNSGSAILYVIGQTALGEVVTNPFTVFNQGITNVVATNVFGLLPGTGVTFSTNFANGAVTIFATGGGGSTNGIAMLSGGGTNTYLLYPTMQFLNFLGGSNNTTVSGSTIQFGANYVPAGQYNAIVQGTAYGVSGNTISGGQSNTIGTATASTYILQDTIAGGNGNFIGNGTQVGNTVSGLANQTTGNSSGQVSGSVALGQDNTIYSAAGLFLNGVVALGSSNYVSAAGSFAFGTTATNQNANAFVWSDGTSKNANSSNTNQFNIFSKNGVGINTNNPGTNALEVLGYIDTTVGFSVNGVPLSGSGFNLLSVSNSYGSGSNAVVVSALTVSNSNQTAASFVDTYAGYASINLQNPNTGNGSSSLFAALADDSSISFSQFNAQFGINNKEYNSAGGYGSTNDAFIFVQGAPSNVSGFATNGGNLWITLPQTNAALIVNVGNGANNQTNVLFQKSNTLFVQNVTLNSTLTVGGSVGTAGNVLVSGGAGAALSWGAGGGGITLLQVSNSYASGTNSIMANTITATNQFVGNGVTITNIQATNVAGLLSWSNTVLVGITTNVQGGFFGTFNGTNQNFYNTGAFNTTNAYVTEIADFWGNTNGDTEVSIQNVNAGTNASTSLALVANDGNYSQYFGTFGINSQNYTNINFWGGAHDVYLYAQGNSSATPGASQGNLIIGTANTNTGVYFSIGQNGATNYIANITSNGIAGNGAGLTNIPVAGVATITNFVNTQVTNDTLQPLTIPTNSVAGPFVGVGGPGGTAFALSYNGNAFTNIQAKASVRPSMFGTVGSGDDSILIQAAIDYVCFSNAQAKVIDLAGLSYNCTNTILLRTNAYLSQQYPQYPSYTISGPGILNFGGKTNGDGIHFMTTNNAGETLAYVMLTDFSIIGTGGNQNGSGSTNVTGSGVFIGYGPTNVYAGATAAYGCMLNNLDIEGWKNGVSFTNTVGCEIRNCVLEANWWTAMDMHKADTLRVYGGFHHTRIGTTNYGLACIYLGAQNGAAASVGGITIQSGEWTCGNCLLYCDATSPCTWIGGNIEQPTVNSTNMVCFYNCNTPINFVNINCNFSPNTNTAYGRFAYFNHYGTGSIQQLHVQADIAGPSNFYPNFWIFQDWTTQLEPWFIDTTTQVSNNASMYYSAISGMSNVWINPSGVNRQHNSATVSAVIDPALWINMLPNDGGILSDSALIAADGYGSYLHIRKPSNVDPLATGLSMEALMNNTTTITNLSMKAAQFNLLGGGAFLNGALTNNGALVVTNTVAGASYPNVAAFYGNYGGIVQNTLYNQSTNKLAEAQWSAQANNGSQFSYNVSMGINNSNYNGSGFAGLTNDAYIISYGSTTNLSTSGVGGNLWLMVAPTNAGLYVSVGTATVNVTNLSVTTNGVLINTPLSVSNTVNILGNTVHAGNEAFLGTSNYFQNLVVAAGTMTNTGAHYYGAGLSTANATSMLGLDNTGKVCTNNVPNQGAAYLQQYSWNSGPIALASLTNFFSPFQGADYQTNNALWSSSPQMCPAGSVITNINIWTYGPAGLNLGLGTNTAVYFYTNGIVQASAPIMTLLGGALNIGYTNSGTGTIALAGGTNQITLCLSNFVTSLFTNRIAISYQILHP